MEDACKEKKAMRRLLNDTEERAMENRQGQCQGPLGDFKPIKPHAALSRLPGIQTHDYEEGREVSVQRAQLRPDGHRLRPEREQCLLPLYLSPAATEPSGVH